MRKAFDFSVGVATGVALSCVVFVAAYLYLGYLLDGD